MSHKKVNIIELAVKKVYDSILDGTNNASPYITNGIASRPGVSKLQLVNAIQPTLFANYCQHVYGVKTTTAVRYLRTFRAADRRRA